MHVRVLGRRLDGSLERGWISGRDRRSRNGSQLRHGARLGRLRLSRGEVSNVTPFIYPILPLIIPRSSKRGHRSPASVIFI